MRAFAGRDKADLLEALAVDHMHAVYHHVGYIKNLAVWRDAHVLRHAGRGANICACRVVGVRNVLVFFAGRGDQRQDVRTVKVSVELERVDHFAVDQINLGNGAVELARKQRKLAVNREISVVDTCAFRRRNGEFHGQRFGVTKVKAFVSLCHDDGELAVG